MSISKYWSRSNIVMLYMTYNDFKKVFETGNGGKKDKLKILPLMYRQTNFP